MKKDVTGRAADLAFEISKRVLARMEKIVPLGPDRARFTRSELMTELAKMGTAGVEAFRDQLTPEEQQEILKRAAAKEQGPSREPTFIPEKETLE